MHTALRAVALFLVAGVLGGGLLIFATDKPESQLAGAALSATDTMSLKLGSPVFEDGGTIPPLYTCDGMNTSPLLTIAGVPAEAQSLALIPGVSRSGATIAMGRILGYRR